MGMFVGLTDRAGGPVELLPRTRVYWTFTKMRALFFGFEYMRMGVRNREKCPVSRIRTGRNYGQAVFVTSADYRRKWPVVPLSR